MWDDLVGTLAGSRALKVRGSPRFFSCCGAGPCSLFLIKGRVGFIIGTPPVFFHSAMLALC